MICGNLDIYDPLISSYVATTGVPMLAVAYRLAPEHPHPVPVEDSYAGFRWLIDNAEKLGVNPARIAVMGDSAGGGLTAGLALLARDRGLGLARQMMIYPMLDDRNTITDETLAPFAIWTSDYNFTGWSALLNEDLGTDNVSPSAAPSRAKNLIGVAPAYIEVGELDILRNEDIEYARRIACAGISMELHVHAGAPHAFDLIAPHSDLVRRCMADRARVLKAL
jgi:acetyl esterase/lipase